MQELENTLFERFRDEKVIYLGFPDVINETQYIGYRWYQGKVILFFGSDNGEIPLLITKDYVLLDKVINLFKSNFV